MKSGKVLKLKRIREELDNILKFPLTVVSASMGYGKTTSVRLYLEEQEINYTWISLISGDGAETVFWNKIKMAIQIINDEVRNEFEGLEFPIDILQVQEFIDLTKKLPRYKNTVLVIDDYHIIENEKINNLLELIVQENISNFHMVIISRIKPKFNHINLISKGLCHYINTNTLALSQNEIKEYFKLMNFEICNEEIEKIFNYTRGWVSAIYLMLLGLKQGYAICENTNINQLVEKNLFYTLDEETQELLLCLSIFDSFTIEQASYTLINNNILNILDNLIERNAFVEFDDNTGIYKFHNVLLDFLRKKVLNSNMNVTDVCHRAGEWYLKYGDIIEAFNFYFRAGKIEEILKIMNEPNYIDVSYLGYKLQKKIYSIDKNFCVKYPFPFLQIACNFILTGEMETVMLGIEIFETMQEYFSKDVNIPEKVKRRILGELEVLAIFIAFNDIQKMLEHVNKAYEFLDGGISCIIFRYSEISFGIPHFLYTYYKDAGKLSETLDFIVKAFPTSIFDGCGYGCEYAALADYALETGKFDEVQHYAQKAIYKSMTKMQVGIMLCAKFTIMRLCLVEGDFEKAKDILLNSKEQLVNFRKDMTVQNSAIYTTTIDLMEGYLYSCMNNLEMIPNWIKKGDFSEVAFMMQGMAFPCIIYGKAVMLSENWLELETLCEIFKESYEIFNNQLGLIHNGIYLAAAKYNLYGMGKGVEVMEQILNSAEMDGIITPFAENGQFILPMLYEIQRQNTVSSAYVDLVIKSCERYCNNLKLKHSAAVTLTQREIQVIKLMYDGLTQREIADELFVSLSSVKRYVENVYLKLDVNNKITALKKAVDLGII